MITLSFDYISLNKYTLNWVDEKIKTKKSYLMKIIEIFSILLKKN